METAFPCAAGLAETKKGVPAAQHHQKYHGEDAGQGPGGSSSPHCLSELPCDYSPQTFQQKEDFNCFEEEGKKIKMEMGNASVYRYLQVFTVTAFVQKDPSTV